MDKNKKRLIFRFSTCAAAFLIFSSSVTYAWFNRQHKIARMQEVVPPNTIFLSAAHRKAEINFQLGEVNTSATASHKDYVFSVSGAGVPYYLLELAHTTNNPFTYTIYPATFSATQPAGTDGVDYVSFVAPADNTAGSPSTITNIGDVTTGTTYYYTINGGPISGKFLNKASDSPFLANSSGKQHDITYNNTTGHVDLVQKNAEPLYWKSKTLTGNADAFVHNYIIRIDWTGATLDKKTKETDIIYLYARTTLAP
ncbi:hypothetical protein [Ruminococcus flavefaciens]|uniref:Uncharacterized protein n=1 Tax=Ruminococcus flavefaciens TaxID=1265 RepID=A0A1K1NBV3_RUMFL|nr:hypothetical protein [Ruminococcus flavefaciens]SFW32788.1 hypothetical protein SAMN02910280_1805 [Ruminococcus flavefaciens]